jgi:hypothetical protein
MSNTWRTYLYFIAISALIFAFHCLVHMAIDQGIWSSVMIQSYVINFGLGLVLIVGADYLLGRQSNNVGWAFIVLSALKFILFFAFISPEIKQDGVTTAIEISSFFVPYLACLFMEIRILAKRLNAL